MKECCKQRSDRELLNLNIELGAGGISSHGATPNIWISTLNLGAQEVEAGIVLPLKWSNFLSIYVPIVGVLGVN